jgi:uncharacterized coiled-coil protein SlyX
MMHRVSKKNIRNELEKKLTTQKAEQEQSISEISTQISNIIDEINQLNVHKADMLKEVCFV